MSKFTVYVDFDNTLYDTKKFAKDLWELLAEKSSLPVEQVLADIPKHTSDPRLGGYDYAAHIDAYRLDQAEMWRLLEDLVANNNYLHVDSVAFMDYLFSQGLQPRILSFGEPRFQRIKIEPTLGRLAGQANRPSSEPRKVTFEVIQRPKGEHISTKHRGQQGVLVDDVVDQRLPNGFAVIHLDRGLGLAQAMPKASGYTVADLMQAQHVIRRLV